MFNLSDEAQVFLENNRNKSIVFTNGCFDLLHSGHVAYLNEAKSLGDLLFVGINSDLSVSELKGLTRPIVTETERKFVLENLKSVDFVEIFSQETPLELIKAVNPDFLVKGGDWEIDRIVGSEHVLKQKGQVKSLKFKVGFSSTSIIEKIIAGK